MSSSNLLTKLENFRSVQCKLGSFEQRVSYSNEDLNVVLNAEAALLLCILTDIFFFSFCRSQCSDRTPILFYLISAYLIAPPVRH